MENQEINAKEAQVTARSLNNSWIPRSYTFVVLAQAQPAAVTEDDADAREAGKIRLKSWIPWPVI